MTNKTVAIKITADGKAFEVTMTGSAAAVEKLQQKLKGAGEEFDKFKNKTQVAPATFTEPLRKMGDQAEQTARQMRQVAPQITDIVTQVAAGQSPLQIFIQQGGQLKDVFGGTGPALRAVGSYVAALITPVTVATGVIGGLAFAWVKGSQDSAQFNRQLLLSGDTAGITAGRYQDIATALMGMGASRGAALETLTGLAQQGRVGEANLQRYAAIAQDLERLVGKPVQDTVKEFQALADQPAAASAKLTQTYGYLTAATYDQIRALENAGQHTEAARVAQEAFAASMGERIPKMREQLGFLERGWLSVKDAIHSVGGALLDIGRPQTNKEQLAVLERELTIRRERNRELGIVEGESTRQLERQIAALKQQETSGAKVAAQAADRAATAQAAVRYDQLQEQYLTGQLKLKRELQKVEAEGLAAGKSVEQIERLKAEVRKRVIDQELKDELALRQAAVDLQGKIEAGQVKENIERVTQLYRIGAISQQQYIQTVGDLEVKILEDDKRRVKERIEIAKQGQNSDREVRTLQLELAGVDEAIAARRRKTGAELVASQENLKEAIDATNLSMQKQWDDDIARAQAEAIQRWNQAARSVSSYTLALRDEGEELQFQISIMGQTGTALQRQIELRKIYIALRQKEREIENSGLTATEQNTLKGLARQAAVEAAARVDTKIWLDTWNSAAKESGEMLYDALTGRGMQARDRLKTLFENLVLRPTVMPYLQEGGNAIASFLTGGNPTSGGGGFNLGSLLNFAGSSTSGGGTSSITNSIASYFGGSGVAGTAAGAAEIAATGEATSLALSGAGAAAAEASTAGAALAASMGETAVVASTLGAGMAAAIPYIGWIYAAYVLLSGQFKGETRAGGQYGYSVDGTSVLNPRRSLTLPASGVGATFLEGPSGGDANSAAAKAAINTTVATINTILKGVGSSITLTQAQGGYEASDRDRGGVFVGGSFSNGQRFGESGQGDNYAGTLYEKTSANNGDLQAIFQNFVTDNKQAVIQAVQALASEIPKTLSDLVKGIDAEGLSDADAQGIVDRITSVVQAVGQLDGAIAQLPSGFEELKAASFDVKAAVIDSAGGFQSLAAALGNFYDKAFTATEKQAAQMTYLTSVFEKAGVVLPASVTGYRNAVLEAERHLDSDEGRATFATLISNFDLFYQAMDKAGDVTESTADRIDSWQKAYFAAWAPKAALQAGSMVQFAVASAMSAVRDKINGLVRDIKTQIMEIRGQWKDEISPDNLQDAQQQFAAALQTVMSRGPGATEAAAQLPALAQALNAQLAGNAGSRIDLIGGQAYIAQGLQDTLLPLRLLQQAQLAGLSSNLAGRTILPNTGIATRGAQRDLLDLGIGSSTRPRFDGDHGREIVNQLRDLNRTTTKMQAETFATAIKTHETLGHIREVRERGVYVLPSPSGEAIPTV